MNGTASSPDPADSSLSAGTKRKRSSAGKYYAVKKGYQPGVYYDWKACQSQITGYKGAVFQSFPSFEDANAFLTGSKPPPGHARTSAGPESTRFYGIQRGRVPGVYTNWAQAQYQIKGFMRPRYRKFSTREEAEEFVRMGHDPATAAGDAGPTPSKVPGMVSEATKDVEGVPFAPGEGPLPPGAEDKFDPNVLLDPATGKVVHKTPEQKAATMPKSTEPPGMLRIYTDGSTLNNGRNLACAGVGVYFGPGDTKNVSEPLKGNRQTNQRAELTAIDRALDIAPRHRDVTIFSDSQYAIKCVTEWFINWRRNNWMTSDKKPVENKDLVEPILAKIEERERLKVKTRFQWVKGHSHNAGNVEADRLAVNGARVGVSEKALEGEIPDEVFQEDF